MTYAASRSVAKQGRHTAFTLALEIHQIHRIPVFPVRLFQEDGKWQKRPLVKWGSVSGDPYEEVWHSANAVGVPMGKRSGLITIDLDDYKTDAETARWLRGHDIPRTRMHKTASGGRHLIFRLPDRAGLGNQAPGVTGVDVRGNGGFIVWGDLLGRYTVLQDCRPAKMPESLVEELQALTGNSRSHQLTGAQIPPYVPVNNLLLIKKVERALANISDRNFRNRFNGSTSGLKDKSRSGMDMSIAALLASRDFGFWEITAVLLEHFPHGTASRDGWTDTSERAAKRCALRAIQHAEDKKKVRIEYLKQTLVQLDTELRHSWKVDQ